MQPADYVLLGFGAVRSHRLRSFLSTLGIAIGITAVILLTSIGEGTRRYLVSEFTQFGTNILQINPGKTETMGLPGVLGGTTHKLTLDDAEAALEPIGLEALDFEIDEDGDERVADLGPLQTKRLRDDELLEPGTASSGGGVA